MNWILWAILGVVMIIGGFIALANPFAATLAAEQIAGWIFLFAGVLQAIAIFMSSGWSNRLWALLLTVVFLWLGVTLLFNPLAGILALTLAAGIGFLASGAAKSVFSFSTRGTQFFWPILISGLVSVVLGLMVLFNFPQSAAVLLGILLAVELISSGVTVLFAAFILKKYKSFDAAEQDAA